MLLQVYVRAHACIYVGYNFVNSTGTDLSIFGIWLESHGATIEHNAIHARANGIEFTSGYGKCMHAIIVAHKNPKTYKGSMLFVESFGD
jgi:hypothetical protein